MIILRKILLFKSLYITIFLISLLYLFITINIDYTSKYEGSEKFVVGSISNLSYDGNKLTINLKAKEQIIATYYFDTKKHLNDIKNTLSLGDTIKLEGELKKPISSNNFYGFSYYSYLKNRKVFYLMDISNIELVKKNSNILFTFKSLVRNSIKNDKAGEYINIFFLGIDNNFDNNLISKFQKLGISHLFALSGTQISFLIIIISFLLKRIISSQKIRFLISFFILVLYYLIIESCAAIDRALVFNLIFALNNIFNFNIKPSFLIILSLSILFFINPFYIYDIGFQYSTIISVTLILIMIGKENTNKIRELLKISWVSFLVSLPISLYHFSYINILSIIYNLFYVPFINIVIFPLSMICIIFPFLNSILEFFIYIFEGSVNLLSNIKIGTIVLARIPFVFYLLYYVIIFSYLYFKKKLIFAIFLCFVTFHYLTPKIYCHDRVYMIDVGQGDSFLLISNNKTMLIDTGGIMDYSTEEWERRKKTNRGRYTVTFLYQLGIEKLNYLLLSHGDYDHAGEALNIMREIDVDNVLFNSNRLNSLEKEISKNSKRSYKLTEGSTFTLGNFNFLVINDTFDDENDSSSVLYTTIHDKKLLFMGDATIKSENYILDNYNIKDITILKVGHHGSRTSSSEEFIKKINPTYALISAGIDNRFNHPHKEVVDRLAYNNTIIYDVREKGMTMFDFTNNTIKTYK